MVTASQRAVVGRHAWRQWITNYLLLTKARLAVLVLATTLAGFLLARPRATDSWLLTATLVGTGLTVLGASALNQWMEAGRDARMTRARLRPLPAGKMSPSHALFLSAGLLIAGPSLLWVEVNWLTASLSALSAAIYLGIYTPLKTRTSLCTLVGSICGAIPPVMGWTAATGRIDPPAVMLAAILLVWQIPHFLALAWLHRDEYRRAGFRVLPVIDRGGEATGMMALLYSLALVPIGLTAVLVGLGGWLYALGCVALGVGLTLLASRFHHCRTTTSARQLSLATLVYLPLLLAFMLVDHGPISSLITAR